MLSEVDVVVDVVVVVLSAVVDGVVSSTTTSTIHVVPLATYPVGHVAIHSELCKNKGLLHEVQVAAVPTHVKQVASQLDH
jgi:hypothetical protein